ncbi:Stress responsive A/B Barrel Domain-containing protein [Chthonomonas calidirosea]|uniref:Stress responsive A/B Barrel Domain n=1 Tax=Chthonomonas calidirosea (strain DSM 23976 / ICMP 18418 / T49) TaxID=1303518 RepID=S0EZ71_CHTCT|nr:Dabb family protein [Chthonomonas calidirosea]CCW35530.1 Stress responsive A/B Barrel Domain [Chthonomonas calidirosea T49]CEK18997.1 Stress responsive A/B Barrel Domain-containing protein [Chthonomonas calidirosea]CEK19012.1 Stress responsive A/B Barrel Domain-containing protein [Chthonomonas calidirosea]CEK20000.1 Stress responsive A/B Barrel Domain-containing protein [Chthonomonas calidirosea]
MIEHLVLFRWKEGVSETTIEEVMRRLRALPQQIEGILELNCGRDFSGRSKGYTHALRVRFVNRQALENYGPHPAHQEVVQKLILPNTADILAFDFQVE